MQSSRAPVSRAPASRTPARTTALAVLACAALSLAQPVRAQDAEPEAPASAPAAPKPRVKPKPKSKPAAKPAAAPAAEAPAPAHAAWPEGASSVSESYGDWSVNCTRPKETVACIVVQSQGDAKTGRRKFAFELAAPRDGRAEGTVLMPFGLAIDPGVTFKLDEQALGKGAPYMACTGEGCLVPISFPALATDGMKAAKALTVTGQKQGGEAATITVPLLGFPQAFERAIALSG